MGSKELKYLDVFELKLVYQTPSMRPWAFCLKN
jgi:hypothetical protein